MTVRFSMTGLCLFEDVPAELWGCSTTVKMEAPFEEVCVSRHCMSERLMVYAIMSLGVLLTIACNRTAHLRPCGIEKCHNGWQIILLDGPLIDIKDIHVTLHKPTQVLAYKWTSVGTQTQIESIISVCSSAFTCFASKLTCNATS